MRKDQAELIEAAQAVVAEAANMAMTMRRRKIFDALKAALSRRPETDQAEAPKADVAKLIREYRPSMPADVMHLWAKDVVAVLSSLAAPVPAQSVVDALEEAAQVARREWLNTENGDVEQACLRIEDGIRKIRAAALSPHNPTGE